LSDPFEGVKWLFCGVPAESPEVKSVNASGEILPPRPDRVGEDWRHKHMVGDTDTGYTSWTINRDTAYEFGEAASDDYATGGQVVIFRVRVDSLSMDLVFQGRDDEDEFLLQGSVEEVSISDGYEDDEERDSD
jgi:hypothetical protein